MFSVSCGAVNTTLVRQAAEVREFAEHYASRFDANIRFLSEANRRRAESAVSASFLRAMALERACVALEVTLSDSVETADMQAVINNVARLQAATLLPGRLEPPTAGERGDCLAELIARQTRDDALSMLERVWPKPEALMVPRQFSSFSVLVAPSLSSSSSSSSSSAHFYEPRAAVAAAALFPFPSHGESEGERVPPYHIVGASAAAQVWPQPLTAFAAGKFKLRLHAPDHRIDISIGYARDHDALLSVRPGLGEYDCRAVHNMSYVQSVWCNPLILPRFGPNVVVAYWEGGRTVELLVHVGSTTPSVHPLSPTHQGPPCQYALAPRLNQSSSRSVGRSYSHAVMWPNTNRCYASYNNVLTMFRITADRSHDDDCPLPGKCVGLAVASAENLLALCEVTGWLVLCSYFYDAKTYKLIKLWERPLRCAAGGEVAMCVTGDTIMVFHATLSLSVPMRGDFCYSSAEVPNIASYRPIGAVYLADRETVLLLNAAAESGTSQLIHAFSMGRCNGINILQQYLPAASAHFSELTKCGNSPTRSLSYANGRLFGLHVTGTLGMIGPAGLP